MSDTIQIQIDRADGSLQRLIGLIERRGFHIDQMSLTDCGATREVHVRVRPRDDGRCVNVLSRQIDRLFGCTRIAQTERAPSQQSLDSDVFEAEVESCAA